MVSGSSAKSANFTIRGLLLVISAILIASSSNELNAQDWRLSGSYNVQQVGFNYIPNNSYPGEIRVGSKGMFEVELERYLLYRLYIAGKAEVLYHNEETVFLGGPVNFQQVNLGASIGLQGDKWGIYGGVKGGRIWDISIMGMDAEKNISWLPPTENSSQYTAAFTGGIKYYLMSFLRLQLEVSKSFNLPSSVTPSSTPGVNPAFNSFEFNPLSLSLGVSVSIPWHSKNRIERLNDRGSLPILDAGSVNFSAPIKSPAIITSQYGPRWNRTHQGVDIDAERGQNIFAAADGVVVKAGIGTGYGKMVKILHSGGFSTIYAHLRRIKVKNGQKVRKGDVIGKAGNTGTSSGVHLHFEILKNEARVDPQSYIRF